MGGWGLWLHAYRASVWGDKVLEIGRSDGYTRL